MTTIKPTKDLKNTHIRGIPGESYRQLRIEAARREVSVNELIVDILTKAAKRFEKKGG